MAGAGVPVSMDDGTGIAAAPAIVCPLPGVARSGQKWPLKGTWAQLFGFGFGFGFGCDANAFFFSG